MSIDTTRPGVGSTGTTEEREETDRPTVYVPQMQALTALPDDPMTFQVQMIPWGILPPDDPARRVLVRLAEAGKVTRVDPPHPDLPGDPWRLIVTGVWFTVEQFRHHYARHPETFDQHVRG